MSPFLYTTVQNCPSFNQNLIDNNLFQSTLNKSENVRKPCTTDHFPPSIYLFIYFIIDVEIKYGQFKNKYKYIAKTNDDCVLIWIKPYTNNEIN